MLGPKGQAMRKGFHRAAEVEIIRAFGDVSTGCQREW